MAATFAVAVLGLLATAKPAAASCAWPPRLSESPFTGTVVSVDPTGRVATVRTDDGKTVTVLGGPANPREMTSVDRTYAPGTRYEFHPINNSDPYEDNICTATHELAATGLPQPTASPSGAIPSSSTNWMWPTATVILAALAVAAAIAWRRRRRGPAAT